MDPSQLRAHIEHAARELGFLADGDLRLIDSIEMINFVVELETVLQIEIPTAQLRQQFFASIDALQAMLLGLMRGRPSP